MTAARTVALLIGVCIVATRSFPVGESLFAPSSNTVSWLNASSVCTQPMELAMVSSLQIPSNVKKGEEFWVNKRNDSDSPCSSVILVGDVWSLKRTTDCNKKLRALCISGPGTGMRMLLYIGVGCHTLVSVIFITVCLAKRNISTKRTVGPGKKHVTIDKKCHLRETDNKVEGKSCNKETVSALDMTRESNGQDKTCTDLAYEEHLSLEQEPTLPAQPPIGTEEHLSLKQESTFPAPPSEGTEEYPALEQGPTLQDPPPVGTREHISLEQEPTLPAPPPVGTEEHLSLEQEFTLPAPPPVGTEEHISLQQESTLPAPPPVGTEEHLTLEQEPTLPPLPPVGTEEHLSLQQGSTLQDPPQVGTEEHLSLEQEPTLPAPLPVGTEEHISLEQEPTLPILSSIGSEDHLSIGD